jgi:hypothetical protein
MVQVPDCSSPTPHSSRPCVHFLSALPSCAQACTKFPHCDRKICFFAHGEEQLRHADYSFGYASVAEAVSGGPPTPHPMPLLPPPHKPHQPQLRAVP